MCDGKQLSCIISNKEIKNKLDHQTNKLKCIRRAQSEKAMENDSDYPYLDIYPPFSFYMNSDTEGNEQEGLNEKSGFSSTGRNKAVSEVTNEKLCSDFRNAMIEHNYSSVSNSSCGMRDANKDQLNDKETPINPCSQRLCNQEPKADSPYTVECDYISDIEYEPDSGFNSAATSPAPTEYDENIHMLNSSAIIAEKLTTSPTSVNSNDRKDDAIYAQNTKSNATTHPDVHRINMEPSIPSFPIPSTQDTHAAGSSNICVKTSSIRPSIQDCSGIYQSHTRGRGADTVTVSSYYPRMYTGSIPRVRMCFPDSAQQGKQGMCVPPSFVPGRMPITVPQGYLSPDQPPRYAPRYPTFNNPYPFLAQVYPGYSGGCTRCPTFSQDSSSGNFSWNHLGYTSSLPCYPLEHNCNMEFHSTEPFIYRASGMIRGMPQVRYQHVNDFGQRSYDNGKISGGTQFPPQPSNPGAYQLLHPARVPTDLRSAHPVCASEDRDPDHTLSWSDSFEEFAMDKNSSTLVFPDSTTQPQESKPTSKKRRPNNTSTSTSTRVQKPPETYMILIAKAILACETGRASLTEIYEHIMMQHSFYRDTTLSWRNAVRHNRSTNECFVKAGRTETGRGYYWAIHPTCVQAFRKGNFDRRQARRKAQHASRTGEQVEMNKVPISPPISQSYNIPDSRQKTEYCYLPPPLS